MKYEAALSSHFKIPIFCDCPHFLLNLTLRRKTRNGKKTFANI